MARSEDQVQPIGHGKCRMVKHRIPQNRTPVKPRIPAAKVAYSNSQKHYKMLLAIIPIDPRRRSNLLSGRAKESKASKANRGASVFQCSDEPGYLGKG